MGSSGSGSYLDPDHVFALLVTRRPRDLFDYLQSIPGASMDLQCHLISFAGSALLAPRLGFFSTPSLLPLPDEDSWTLYWAKYAWAHAASSRLCAPHMVGNPINFAAYPDHYLHPLNSSPYSGKMLTAPEPGRNVVSQLSASSSSIPTATVSPEQTNYNGTVNQTFGFSSGSHPSSFSPWQADSILTTDFAELSLDQPGSKQMDPQKLIQNKNGDMKGKRLAPEVVQQKLRVNVASLIAEDGTKGGAGLLIKNITGQFICAACFQLRGAETALFAAACCEAFRIAHAYQPTAIVLKSHQLPLMEFLLEVRSPGPEMELLEFLEPPSYTIQFITEESNGVARRLAMRSLLMGVCHIFFSQPPDWLALT